MKHKSLKRFLKAFAFFVAFTLIIQSIMIPVTFAQEEFEEEIEEEIEEEYEETVKDEFHTDSDIGNIDTTIEETEGADKVTDDGISSGVSVVPSENNAYILFGKTIKTNHMDYIDGYESGIANPSSPLYNEMFEMDGVTGRKVYKENYVSFSLKDTYFEPGDTKFMILLTYYDFGPSVGYFRFEYMNTDNQLSTVSVRKEGIVPKWCTTRIYVDDADFTKTVDGTNAMQIGTNAYNAFAKVEIINISVSERTGEQVELGAVNSIQAEALGILGLMEGENGAPATAGLEKKLTRGETVKMLVKAFGKEKEAMANNYSCSFSDVPESLKPYVGYCENEGMISGNGMGKFNPDDIATPRQLMTFMLRYLGFEDENLYDNAVELAKENKLVLNFDMILYPDGDLTRDHFAAIVYNGCLIERKEDDSTILFDNLTSGNITEEMCEATGVQEILAYKYMLPRKVPKKTVVDESSGRTYYFMNIDDAQTIRSYFNHFEWNEAEDKFIVAHNKSGAMYEYDINTEMLRFLDYVCVSGSLSAEVIANDQIYYKKKDGSYWHYDWKNYKKQKICDAPEWSQSFDDGFSATFDGRYIATKIKSVESEKDFFNGENRFRLICRYDTVEKKWEYMSKEFDEIPEYPHVGHPNINPVDGNLVGYCHEGTTYYIPDRIWYVNFETGEHFNPFKQGMHLSGITTSEPTGHEMWDFDGDSILFVKYPFANNLGKSGLARVSMDGTEVEYINNDYKWWHPCTTEDGEWIGGDVQTDPRQIAIVNSNNYESYLMATIKVGPNGNHPYQAHPSYSQSGKWLIWGMCDENDILGVAWMDVSDLTSQHYPGGLVEFNENISYADYDNTRFQVDTATVNGTECIKAPVESSIYFDINDSLIRTPEGNVKIEFTYLDNGTNEIDVIYTNTTKLPVDYANYEDASISIKRSGSGKWKTATVHLKNASLEDTCAHLTDFAIRGRMSDVYIKDISVTVE